MLGLVVGDLDRLDLPERRARRVLGAELAGRIDGVVELVDVAARALAGGGRQPRLVAEQQPDALDGGFLEVLGEFGVVGKDGVAVLVGQVDIARRGDGLRLLVVGHRVGVDDAVAARDLDMAAGGDDADVAVIGHLVGDQQDRDLVAGLLLRLARRLAGIALRVTRGGHQKAGGHQDSPQQPPRHWPNVPLARFAAAHYSRKFLASPVAAMDAHVAGGFISAGRCARGRSPLCGTGARRRAPGAATSTGCRP